MAGESMKKAIIDAFADGAEDADAANDKFGSAILADICENMKLKYSWSGVFTPPPPGAPVNDTTNSFEATVSGSGVLKPTGVGYDENEPKAFKGMLSKLESLIKALNVKPPPEFGSLSLSINLPVNTLAGIEMNGSATTQDEAMASFCDQLVTNLQSWKGTLAPAGSHVVGSITYVGAATFISVSWG